MNQIKFELLDLNLLRVFDAVNEERSVVNAAQRLSLTPSGISHALGRLRVLMNDELFVRGPEGMQPTQLATKIGPRIHDVLLQLRVALAPTEFDPNSAEHRFTINCGPYLSAVFLPKLVMRMRIAAPNVRLAVRWAGVDVVEELDSGRIDLALGSFGETPDRLDSEELFEDRLVWAMSAANAPANGVLTLEQLGALPHLVSNPLDDGWTGSDRSMFIHGLQRHVPLSNHATLESALAERGLQRNVVLTVPGALAALSIVADSDMVTLVYKRQALGAAREHKLRLFDPPYRLSPIHIKGIWHRNFGSQPPLAWFRTLVKSVAAEMGDVNAEDAEASAA